MVQKQLHSQLEKRNPSILKCYNFDAHICTQRGQTCQPRREDQCENWKWGKIFLEYLLIIWHWRLNSGNFLTLITLKNIVLKGNFVIITAKMWEFANQQWAIECVNSSFLQRLGNYQKMIWMIYELASEFFLFIYFTISPWADTLFFGAGVDVTGVEVGSVFSVSLLTSALNSDSGTSTSSISWSSPATR